MEGREVGISPVSLPPEILVQCLLPLCGRDLFKNVAMVSTAFYSIVTSESFCKEKFVCDTANLLTNEQRQTLYKSHESSWYKVLEAHSIAQTKVYLMVWALLDKPHEERAPKEFLLFSYQETYEFFTHIWEKIYIRILNEQSLKDEEEVPPVLTGPTEGEYLNPVFMGKRKRGGEEVSAAKMKRLEEVVDISSQFVDELVAYVSTLNELSCRVHALPKTEQIGDMAVGLDMLLADWGAGTFQDCFRSIQAYEEFMVREKGYATQVTGWATEFLRVSGNIVHREKGLVLASFPGPAAFYFLMPSSYCAFLKKPLRPIIPLTLWKF